MNTLSKACQFNEILVRVHQAASGITQTKHVLFVGDIVFSAVCGGLEAFPLSGLHGNQSSGCNVGEKDRNRLRDQANGRPQVLEEEILKYVKPHPRLQHLVDVLDQGEVP